MWIYKYFLVHTISVFPVFSFSNAGVVTSHRKCTTTSVASVKFVELSNLNWYDSLVSRCVWIPAGWFYVLSCLTTILRLNYYFHVLHCTEWNSPGLILYRALNFEPGPMSLPIVFFWILGESYCVLQKPLGYPVFWLSAVILLPYTQYFIYFSNVKSKWKLWKKATFSSGELEKPSFFVRRPKIIKI